MPKPMAPRPTKPISDIFLSFFLLFLVYILSDTLGNLPIVILLDLEGLPSSICLQMWVALIDVATKAESDLVRTRDLSGENKLVYSTSEMGIRNGGYAKLLLMFCCFSSFAYVVHFTFSPRPANYLMRTCRLSTLYSVSHNIL